MIARRLNEQNIPSPSMIHHLRGEFDKLPPDALNIWQAQMIKSITGNMVYAGHMAQGKQYRSLCDGIKPTEMKKEDWIIVPNTHEPIVDNETFEAVQAMNEQQKIKAKAKQGKHPTTENILMGLVFCADCGKTMTRNKNRSKKGTVRYTFVCRTRRDTIESTGCTLKSIGEPELMHTILVRLQNEIDMTVEQERLIEKLKACPGYQSEQKELETALQKAQAECSKNTMLRSGLFEHYNDKLITEDEYWDYKQKFDEDAKRLDEELARLHKLQAVHSKTISPQNVWMRTFRKHMKIETLTREIVVELIQRINISDYNKVTIVWNFKDEYQTLKSYTDEVAPKKECEAE